MHYEPSIKDIHSISKRATHKIYVFLFQCVLCYSTPNTHPYISDAEKKFLNENVDSLIHSKKQELDPVPWKALMHSVPLWTLIIAAVSLFDFVFLTVTHYRISYYYLAYFS